MMTVQGVFLIVAMSAYALVNAWIVYRIWRP
jgi:hypothetical protein